jgi:hypothetical protein
VIALFAEHPVALFAVRTRARSIVSRKLLFDQLDAEVGLCIRQSYAGAAPWIGRTELLRHVVGGDSRLAPTQSKHERDLPQLGFAVTLISRRPLDRKTRRAQAQEAASHEQPGRIFRLTSPAPWASRALGMTSTSRSPCATAFRRRGADRESKEARWESEN